MAVRAGVALTGLAAAVALVVADLSTLYSVNVPGGVTHAYSGHSRHGYALVILGLVTLPMALGALRGSVPAMGALGFLGVVALGITLLGDLGDVNSTGTYGQLYENVTAGPSTGFYAETLGAILLLLAGGTGLVLMGAIPAGRRGPGRGRRRRERGRQPAAETPEGGTGRPGRTVDDWFETAEE